MVALAFDLQTKEIDAPAISGIYTLIVEKVGEVYSYDKIIITE